jgi:hypothetical protein
MNEDMTFETSSKPTVSRRTAYVAAGTSVTS